MLTRWDEPSFGQMIADRAAIPLCGKPNTTPLLHAYRVGEQRARRVAEELQHMLRRIGSDRSWSLPTDIVPAEIGNLGRDEVRLELDARHRNLLERIERTSSVIWKTLSRPNWWARLRGSVSVPAGSTTSSRSGHGRSRRSGLARSSTHTIYWMPGKCGFPHWA